MAKKIYLCLLVICSLAVASLCEVNTIRFARKKRGLYNLNVSYEVGLVPTSDYFLATILVGTPGQKLKVAFDLEKSYSWLVGPLCSTDYCKSRTAFNFGASLSLRPKSRIENVTYRDGSLVKGHVITETMTLGNLKINSQDLILASTSSEFLDEPYDGLIGLAPTTNAQASDLLTPIESLVKEKSMVNSTVHSLAIWNDGGVLILGGVNQNYYKPPINFKSVVTKGMWRVSVPNVLIIKTSTGSKTNQTLSSNVGVGFDSSINYIGVPSNAFGKIRDFAKAKANDDGMLEFDCSANSLDITFQMNDQQLTLPSKSFVNSTDSSACEMNLVEITNDSNWVMGLPFLQNYYSVFDAERGMIGFANLLPKSG